LAANEREFTPMTYLFYSRACAFIRGPRTALRQTLEYPETTGPEAHPVADFRVLGWGTIGIRNGGVRQRSPRRATAVDPLIALRYE
jgi:hypothetical protein